ncbi:hypothetical protein QUF61_00455 [Candidatus Venteria ishoeyi]|uniref:hypothetical protein n=1 Tax=Candidatus Venteria ishoeyi TaxID=1899563 RepID=UPI0025A63407|nr:hypothetical protein [Candidatus Venteria ishoeyi]MDM8544940.1 hypothetical protein [Candidatus Venteria ishoeyi]
MPFAIHNPGLLLITEELQQHPQYQNLEQYPIFQKYCVPFDLRSISKICFKLSDSSRQFISFHYMHSQARHD